MHLIIPEGVEVHVIIGSAPVLGMPGAVVAAPVSPRGSDGSPRHSGRPLLKSLLVVLALGGTFVAGTYAARPPVGAGRAVALAPEAVPPAANLGYGALPAIPSAYPADPALLHDATRAGDGQIPEQFAQQLRQPPTVIPPPGQVAPAPAGGEPRKNGFGLED